MADNKNYYRNSFFWSTLSNILNAIVGFFSVPLLLGFYGKADYGILTLATACNGYMHLLDMGMNVGAVRFFSQWKAKGEHEKIYRVAGTNLSFYLIIALINCLLLLSIAFWGEDFFKVTHNEFLLLRKCLFILAGFSFLSWATTAYNQLLVADKQLDFTMKITCLQNVLKGILIGSILIFKFSIITYFFLLTLIVACAFFPYAYRCKSLHLIDTLRPKNHWGEFKGVLLFSLSIFALSIFQATASQLRPIILGIFVDNAADVLTDYKIILVIPTLIVSIGGVFSTIFLPKTSEMVTRNDITEIRAFAYKYTLITSIVANTLCFPFICGSTDILSAYVGSSYASLSYWQILYIITVLIQIHTTPGNALVLAYGKTKLLVIITAIACVFSLVINAILTKFFGVGSAVIAYFLYVLFIIGGYYLYFYKKLLNLSRLKMFMQFLKPTLISIIIFALINIISFTSIESFFNELFPNRLTYICLFIIKSGIWFILFFISLLVFKILRLSEIKGLFKR